jgi:hypothetical protein
LTRLGALGFNHLMQTLSEFTEELRRKADLETAWATLATNFDANKPRRYVSGVAVSSKKKNARGNAFVAAGLTVTLPVVLLWNHVWLQPVGKVFAIETHGNEVHFKGELANSTRLSWVEDVWMATVCKFTTGASIGPRNLANYPPADGTFYNWTVDEISLTEEGADPSARVLRVWERLPHVSLTSPNETVYWNTR